MVDAGGNDGDHPPALEKDYMMEIRKNQNSFKPMEVTIAETGAFLRVIESRKQKVADVGVASWKPCDWWVSILRELCMASTRKVNPLQVCILMMGHPTLGAMLYHILYLSGSGARSDGYIWKGLPEWSDELCVTKHFFNRFNAECLPMVVARKHMAKGSPTWHYRPTVPGMVARLADVLDLDVAFVRRIVTGEGELSSVGDADSGVSSGGNHRLDASISSGAIADSGVSITNTTTKQTSTKTASETTQSNAVDTASAVGWLDDSVSEILENEGVKVVNAVSFFKKENVNPETLTVDVVKRAIQETVIKRKRDDSRFTGLLLRKVVDEAGKPIVEDKYAGWVNNPSPTLPASEEGDAPLFRQEKGDKPAENVDTSVGDWWDATCNQGELQLGSCWDFFRGAEVVKDENQVVVVSVENPLVARRFARNVAKIMSGIRGDVYQVELVEKGMK